MRSPLELYERALSDLDAPAPVRVRFTDGSSTPLALSRFLAPADRDDHSLLAGVVGPVLDVGCGPGRHLRALTAQRVYALGVDLSPVAVGFARRGGGRAVVGDVFGVVPGAGTWATALLLDGNIGIGGHPARLLSRLRALLAPDGAVLVELDGCDIVSGPALARIETDEDASDWFAWARVSVTEIGALAPRAGMAVEREWQCGERRFACLRVVPGG